MSFLIQAKDSLGFVYFHFQEVISSYVLSILIIMKRLTVGYFKYIWAVYY